MDTLLSVNTQNQNAHQIQSKNNNAEIRIKKIKTTLIHALHRHTYILCYMIRDAKTKLIARDEEEEDRINNKEREIRTKIVYQTKAKQTA